MHYPSTCDPYDRFGWSRLISELELVFYYTRLFRKQRSLICQSKNRSNNMLFIIKQMALLDLINAKKERYLYDRVFRDCYKARDHMFEIDFDDQPGR